MTCRIDGCDNTVRIKKHQLCHNHYEKFRKYGDPLANGWAVRAASMDEEPPVEKKCKVCKQVKPVDEFYRRLTPSLWYYARCKTCHDAYRRAKRLEDKTNRPPRQPVDHGLCDFDGCHNKADVRLRTGPAGWYCKPHFGQWSRNKKLVPLRKREWSYIDEDLRKCTACDKVKPQDAFHRRSDGGVQSNCRECASDTSRISYLIRCKRWDDAAEVLERVPPKPRARLQKRLNDAIANEAEIGGREEESS